MWFVWQHRTSVNFIDYVPLSATFSQHLDWGNILKVNREPFMDFLQSCKPIPTEPRKSNTCLCLPLFTCPLSRQTVWGYWEHNNILTIKTKLQGAVVWFKGHLEHCSPRTSQIRRDTRETLHAAGAKAGIVILPGFQTGSGSTLRSCSCAGGSAWPPERGWGCMRERETSRG